MSDSPDIIKEMANLTFVSKYPRYLSSKKRREVWDESVDRSKNMHLNKFSFLSDYDKKQIEWAFDKVKEVKSVPSMRSLQFGGEAIEKNNERIFNCAVRHIDSLRSFAECFYLLLCGNGVGFGLNDKFLSRLPKLAQPEDKTGAVVHYTVEDTIEGWADSAEVQLMSYFKNTPFTGRKVVFDYSKIRKKGSLLKTSGGKAPGYKGLKNYHDKVKKIFDYIIEEKGQEKLKTIDAYDILMHCADAVLSGGIRRSACSVIFQPEDEDLMNAKTDFKVDNYKGYWDKNDNTWYGSVWVNGYKYKDVELDGEMKYDYLVNQNMVSWIDVEPQRARSNNSCILVRDEVSKEFFDYIIEKTKQWGEPGFVFAKNRYMLYNPCFEVSFYPVTKDGRCGVQFCNLTTQNGANINSKSDFREATIAATIIGTLQSAYTNFEYLNSASKELTEEESLLGVSITGMMDNPDILLDSNSQKEMANLAKETNKIWASKIGVNEAARVTCIKPEGTSSIVLGSASGIHPHHSKKYIRRVQMNKEDNIYQFFKYYNSHACKESVWSANNTDDVIEFPIELDKNVMTKDDLDSLKHLGIIKETQKNWVNVGSNTDNNYKDLTHNVSCTVVVDGNWEDISGYIYDNKEYFSAVSLISKIGDKQFPQAPNESVINDEDEKKFNYLKENWKSVDYSELKEYGDKTTRQLEAACVGGNCEVTHI